MSRALYKVSREVAYIGSIFIFVLFLTKHNYVRAFMELILLALFILTSIQYERKRKIITPGYFFIFFILYIVNSLLSCYYDEVTIENINSTGTVAWWPGDYFNLYFIVDIICYLLIIIYCKIFCKKTVNKDFTVKKISANQEYKYLLGIGLLAILYFISGKNIEILIPGFVYFSIQAIFNRKKRIIDLLGIIILLAIGGYKIVQQRFMLIIVAFPIVLAIIILYRPKKNISALQFNLLIVLGVLLVCVYGMVSEIYKLNTFYGRDINVFKELISFDSIIYYFVKQFDRLFNIWIKLGGYIIYHTQENGFYHGITYIKALSGIFGFEYVSLPLISASYHGSLYAQPGLLAEGYANFGIFGAVINLLIVFIVMELCMNIFIKKRTYISLLIALVPFTKILLDGGSLNSALFLIILCMVIGFSDFVKLRRVKKNRSKKLIRREANVN